MAEPCARCGLEIKRSHKQYKRLTDGLTEHLDTETCVQMLLRDRKQMQARAEKAEARCDALAQLSGHLLVVADMEFEELAIANKLPADVKSLVEAAPVKIVLNEDAGLLGAARYTLVQRAFRP